MRYLFLNVAAMLMATGGVCLAATSPLPPEQVLLRMEERNAARFQALQSYQARRRYQAENPFLVRPAYLVVKEEYRAPEERKFTVIEKNVPAQLDKLLFGKLLHAELATTRTAGRLAAEICRKNYGFTFLSFDPAAHAYVFEIDPVGSGPYLLRGRVWINAEDFAVQRLEGTPAGSTSFWVRESHLIFEFARFGKFWFPVRSRSEAELRMFGKAKLEIDYSDYVWQSR